MAVEPMPDTKHVMTLEARAHYLRTAMLNDADFMAGVKTGYEEVQRGEIVSLEELKRELGLE